MGNLLGASLGAGGYPLIKDTRGTKDIRIDFVVLEVLGVFCSGGREPCLGSGVR
jgi:hypothetical protein